MAQGLDRYVGEFRFVFYAPAGRYEATVAFYRDTLDFPIIGGFPGGTYIGASTGVIEIIDVDAVDDGLKDFVFQRSSAFEPADGGFLLVEVRDVNALAGRLALAGVSLVQELRDWPWRFRDCKVVDPAGNLVCLFSRLPGWEAFHGEARPTPD